MFSLTWIENVCAPLSLSGKPCRRFGTVSEIPLLVDARLSCVLELTKSRDRVPALLLCSTFALLTTKSSSRTSESDLFPLFCPAEAFLVGIDLLRDNFNAGVGATPVRVMSINFCYHTIQRKGDLQKKERRVPLPQSALAFPLTFSASGRP